MKAVWFWIKSNPIAVVAAVLCIAAVLGLIVIQVKGGKFVNEVEQRIGQFTQINNLRSRDVRVPASEIDSPPVTHKIVVTQPAIDSLKSVFDDIGAQYQGIFRLAVQQNQVRHGPLIDGLFPQPAPGDFHTILQARTPYLAAFDEMMRSYSPSSLYPQLNAKGPLTQARIADEMRDIEFEFLSGGVIPRTIASLTFQEAQQLRTRQQRRWLELLVSHAETTHIYAQTSREGAGYPFKIRTWTPGRPTLAEVWESQMDLWVQQDIVEVIARTNRVDDPSFNVIVAPIKQLLDVTVVEGYVGLTSPGGFGSAPTALMDDMGMDDEIGFRPPQRFGGVPRGGRPMGPVVPGGGLTPDFGTAPTGRRSNDIYDVRHVWVTFVIDSQRMPEFFDNLTRVNFMTVLQMEVSEVDEYQYLQNGYVLGSGDAVQVRALIETVWLRAWTRQLMPREIRTLLGIGEGTNS
jgi:hypothetical protein